MPVNKSWCKGILCHNAQITWQTMSQSPKNGSQRPDNMSQIKILQCTDSILQSPDMSQYPDIMSRCSDNDSMS